MNSRISISVAADRDTISPTDRRKLAEELVLRPKQFCLFFKVLLGDEVMEKFMPAAIVYAKESEHIWFVEGTRSD